MVRKKAKVEKIYRYVIELKEITNVCLSGRNEAVANENPWMDDDLQIVTLNSTLVQANSKKIEVGLPVEVELSRTTKEFGFISFTFKYHENNGKREKYVRLYISTPAGVYDNFLKVFYSYKGKLYVDMLGKEFFRREARITAWEITSDIE